jgi:hypothetical protein
MQGASIIIKASSKYILGSCSLRSEILRMREVRIPFKSKNVFGDQPINGAEIDSPHLFGIPVPCFRSQHNEFYQILSLTFGALLSKR